MCCFVCTASGNHYLHGGDDVFQLRVHHICTCGWCPGLADNFGDGVPEGRAHVPQVDLVVHPPNRYGLHFDHGGCTGVAEPELVLKVSAVTIVFAVLALAIFIVRTKQLVCLLKRVRKCALYVDGHDWNIVAKGCVNLQETPAAVNLQL